DESGRRRIKGNMDIELAIDMLEMTPHLDHVVLFSGDGDFRRLIEAVQRKGVRATVVSTIRSQPPMIADELRRQADQFLELQELAPRIMRDPALREAAMQQRLARQGEGQADDEVDTTPTLPPRYTGQSRPQQGGAENPQQRPPV